MISFLPRTSDSPVSQQWGSSVVQLYTAVIQESEECVVLFCRGKEIHYTQLGSVTWSKLSTHTYAHKLAISISVGYSTFFVPRFSPATIWLKLLTELGTASEHRLAGAYSYAAARSLLTSAFCSILIMISYCKSLVSNILHFKWYFIIYCYWRKLW